MRKVIFKLRCATKHALFLALSMLTFSVHALTPSQVFDKVKDSVVVVKTLDANGKPISQGSGVLLPSGKIGTNCHVVKNGTSFQVGGGKQFVPATLWGSDEDKDICLLDATGLSGGPAKLGQASRLKVGDPVYAVGAPRGLELSLSDGIVSQLRGGSPPFIQTTAAISPGSSGGGLFDAEGQLVGFTTLYIEGAQSINFAMPVEWVGEILPGKKVAQGRSEADWLERYVALSIAGNLTGSRDWCKQWVQAQPGNGRAWSELGNAYMELKRYTMAVKAYRRAVTINPEDSHTWYMLGSAYIQLKSYTEAVDAYQQVVRISPNDDLGAWGRIGLAYEHLNRNIEAVEAYRNTIRFRPMNADAWESLGNTYGELKRYTEAIDALREAVRIEPKMASAWFFLGATYVISGNRTAALEALRQLRHIDPAKAGELFKMIVPLADVSNNAAGGWVIVSSDKTDIQYANPSTIRRKGNMAKMWYLSDFKKAQVADKPIKPYKSTKVQNEYDCEEERMRLLSSSWHSDHMAKGEVVFNENYPSEWSSVSPESVGEDLWLVACFKQ